MMKAIFALTLLLLCAGIATSQSGGSFAITQSVIAGGGGGPSAGGTFSLTGTIGQSIAGANTSGGTFAVQAGFWNSPLSTTAATVPISGRVLDAAGAPLRNVVVSITDSTGSVIVTRTNAFGYFGFDQVQSGQTYVVNISARAHTFATQVLSVNDSLTGLEFRSLD
jgi:hypothetical protein